MALSEWERQFILDEWPPMNKDDLDLFRTVILPAHPGMRENSGVAQTLVAAYRAGQQFAEKMNSHYAAQFAEWAKS